MNDPLDGLLHRLLGDFTSGLRIDGNHVHIKLMGPAANFELRFEAPDPATAAKIREREGEAYAIPVAIRLVNRSWLSHYMPSAVASRAACMPWSG
jgi:hypothetical protein